MVSETDTLPTIASLAGISYTATTLGRDMFDKRFDDKRFAFTMHHTPNPTIGLIGKKYYYRVRYNGSSEGLYDMYSKEPLINHAKEHPKLTKEMKKLTYGIYETSKYIPYFNKRGL